MKNCELCNSSAKLYCESDQAILCWDCDAKVHSANFLVTKHSRILLCHVCQSLTPWHGCGPRFVPTVSVCSDCVSRGNDRNESHIEENERGRDHGDEVDREDDDSESDDVEEDDDEENQVVPWTSTPSSPPPPAVLTSSNSSTRSCMRLRSDEEGISD